MEKARGDARGLAAAQEVDLEAGRAAQRLLPHAQKAQNLHWLRQEGPAECTRAAAERGLVPVAHRAQEADHAGPHPQKQHEEQRVQHPYEWPVNRSH